VDRATRQHIEHAAERAIGNALSAVLTAAVIVQLVRGESASPYAQLLLVAGVVWVIVLAIGFLRARRRV
jgi:Na+/melibiose symporter-like transporter